MKMIVNIDVPELARAIEFYTDALGLRHSRTMDNDVAELTGASAVIYLLQKDFGSKAASTSPPACCYIRHWTPVHIDFVVDDIEVAAARALRAGAVRESECIEWNASKCITFSDPFGHGFCLLEFAGETYGDSGA
ncbi:bleomycin resistance protein [Alcanivorax balearicus MACL04]|uniref:Bleomycin resistance protein n=1 Tax=Alloalcanivorax balearicus MACL04 TaxID=1177182 RepID=A0ABT2QZ90_9GAMM|nr:VOC family protein [Alloalcanivorax balearicus]MCU5782845.1 bleomycin resistance protein [Alloalcanivorax balearicus MACL04]